MAACDAAAAAPAAPEPPRSALPLKVSSGGAAAVTVGASVSAFVGASVSAFVGAFVGASVGATVVASAWIGLPLAGLLRTRNNRLAKVSVKKGAYTHKHTHTRPAHPAPRRAKHIPNTHNSNGKLTAAHRSHRFHLPVRQLPITSSLFAITHIRQAVPSWDTSPPDAVISSGRVHGGPLPGGGGG